MAMAEKARELFNKLDKNTDGKISISDLKEMLLLMGMKPSYEELKDIMEKFDRNGDGYIDLKEFLEYYYRNNINADSKKLLLRVDGFEFGFGLDLFIRRVKEKILFVAQEFLDFARDFPRMVKLLGFPNDTDVLRLAWRIFRPEFQEIGKEFHDLLRAVVYERDGKMSVSDMKGLLLLMGRKPTKEDLEDMMDKLDKDRDGYIDLKDFLVVLDSAGIPCKFQGFLEYLYENRSNTTKDRHLVDAEGGASLPARVCGGVHQLRLPNQEFNMRSIDDACMMPSF